MENKYERNCSKSWAQIGISGKILWREGLCFGLSHIGGFLCCWVFLSYWEYLPRPFQKAQFLEENEDQFRKSFRNKKILLIRHCNESTIFPRKILIHKIFIFAFYLTHINRYLFMIFNKFSLIIFTYNNNWKLKYHKLN